MVEMKPEIGIAAKANLARIVTAEGKVRTYDMGGKDSTLDVAQAVADYAGPMKKAAHETCEWTRNFF